MVRNHHHRIDQAGLAADIGDHQVLQAIVQVVVAEAIAVTAVVHIVHRHHQKNEKINRRQATWIKFDRYEHQHHRS